MPLVIYFKVAIILFELIACVTAILCWNNIRNSFWKYFPFFLSIIILCETAGYILAFQKNTDLNRLLYIYFVIPLEFLFYYWFVHKLLFRKNRPVFVAGTLTYCLAFLVEIISESRVNKSFFLSLSYTTGNLVLLVFLFIYFFQLVESKRLLTFSRESGFWVCTGLLLFWLGTFPYFGLFNILWPAHLGIFKAYTWVMVVLNYCMYTCFTIAFLCLKKH